MNLPIDISPAAAGVLIVVVVVLALVCFKIIKWGIKLIVSIAIIAVIAGFFLYFFV